MKKRLFLSILSLIFIAVLGCKKSEDADDPTDSGGSYVSITDLSVVEAGSSLATSPLVTWSLGFPIFATLEAGLGSSSTATANISDWADIGAVTSHTFTGLSLTECSSYYPMVRAKDIAGQVLDTHVVTVPFRVDLTDPTVPTSLVVTENATESASSLVSWTASTDNCELTGYQYAIGTTAGDTDVVNWSPVTAVSHRVTSGITLDYGTEYYTSVKSYDSVDRESTVATTAAWRLRSPSALLVGTQNLTGTDFNQGASYVRWSSSTVNSDFFSHSTVTDPEKITVLVAGDYLFRVTMPFQVSATCTTRCAIKALVTVNGAARADSVANSSYVINASGFTESSNHMTVFLPNLSVNDEIKLYVDRGTLEVGTIVTEGIQAYVEYLFSDRDFFYATATQTITSTNLNLAAANITWTQQEASSTYTHNGTTDITLNTTGNYLVQLNFPFEAIGACATRNNVKLQVTLNGVQVTGAQANQGGIDCLNSHTTGSAHWMGMVSAVAGDVLRVVASQEASNSVIQVETGKTGSIIIERLNGIENYISVTGTRTVASTNLNGATASPMQWNTQVATDATTFTHSTVTNNHQITIGATGSYLVFFSDHLTSVTARVNIRIRVVKNGVDVSSGLCTSNIITNSNSNNEGSCSLNFLLSASSGDVITVTAIREAAAGTVTSLSPATLTLLRVK